jgi:hypothetical protein
VFCDTGRYLILLLKISHFRKKFIFTAPGVGFFNNLLIINYLMQNSLCRAGWKLRNYFPFTSHLLPKTCALLLIPNAFGTGLPP